MRHHTRLCAGRSGFTLIELMLVIATISALVGLIVPGLSKARRTARTCVCQSNMRQMQIAVNVYGCDNQQRIANFNWVPGKSNTSFADLETTPATDWLSTQSGQATDIVRRLTGKTNMPWITNRFFNRNYWHLVLVDGGYLGADSSLRVPAVACPEDSLVVYWQDNSENPTALTATVPIETDAPGYERYRPYWGTYQAVPCSFSPDKNVGSRHTLTQIPSRHQLYYGGDSSPVQLPVGQRKLDEVVFPSQKVALFDLYDRHSFKRMIFHAYEVARQPLAFFDGSVRTCKTGDANPGFNPATPTDSAPTNYIYEPSSGFLGYDPPCLYNPLASGFDQVKGYYRWTRDGLAGVDYVKTGALIARSQIVKSLNATRLSEIECLSLSTGMIGGT